MPIVERRAAFFTSNKIAHTDTKEADTLMDADLIAHCSLLTAHRSLLKGSQPLRRLSGSLF